MPLFTSLCACAVVFASLKLATDLYHAAYYGVPIYWTSVVVISVVGTLGFLSGILRARREFGFRVITYIAIFGYFVPYSIVRLLESFIHGPWIFLISVYLVTMLVTLKLGPKWAQGTDQDSTKP